MPHEPDCVLTTFRPAPADDAILDKVQRYWDACAAAGARGGVHDVWVRLVRERHAELLDALDGRRRDRLRELLGNYWREEFSHGYAQGREMTRAISADRAAADAKLRARCARALRVIAEAVGAARRARDPGDGAPQGPEPAFADLARSVAAHTGVPIGIEGELTGGQHALEFDGRVVSEKDLQAYLFACCAARVRRDGAVCEIGPGAGHSAYYHHRFGAERVVLFDLPSVAVVAIWVLCRIEGPDRVWVHGEDPRPSARYFVHPHFRFAGAAADGVRFSTLVNKNSFPEMGHAIASSYFAGAAAYGCRSVFSTNQEFRGLDTVAEAARAAGWRCLSRSPNWIRAAWLDEIFVRD